MSTLIETDDEVECSECGIVISEYDNERHDGECERCYWLRRFRCPKCLAETLIDGRHPSRAGLCQECGDELDQADAERLHDLVESIVDRADETGDFDAVRRAVDLLASLVKQERKPL